MNGENSKVETEQHPDQEGEAEPVVQPPPTLDLHDSVKLMQSVEIASEGTRQLYELRAEERRLRTTLCQMVADILNFLDTSIPINPDLLDTPAYRVEDAYFSSDGVLYMTLEGGERKLKRLSEFEGETILKVIGDVMPKIMRKIEADAHSLNELITVMNKAVKELEKSQPALTRVSASGESEAGDVIREALKV